MEVKIAQTIEGVKLELTVEEAERFVQDPKHLQKQVRSALQEVGLDVPNGRHGGKRTAKAAPRAKAGRHNMYGYGPKVNCKECGQPVCEAMLPLHMRKKHGTKS